VSGPLQKYRYTSPGGHETVMKLNATDAERYGLTDDDLVVPGDEAPAVAKGGVARTAARSGSANKARTGSANKGAGAKPRGASGKPPAETPSPAAPALADPGDGSQTPAADGGDGSGGGD
jgi:hypothetical protein